MVPEMNLVTTTTKFGYIGRGGADESASPQTNKPKEINGDSSQGTM